MASQIMSLSSRVSSQHLGVLVVVINPEDVVEVVVVDDKVVSAVELIKCDEDVSGEVETDVVEIDEVVVDVIGEVVVDVVVEVVPM